MATQRTAIEIPALTGGLNTHRRPDVLELTEVQACENYEHLGDSQLTKRRESEVHDSALNSALANQFSTSILNISAPFYPPIRPTDMTGDYMILAFGNDSGNYKTVLLYETSSGWTVNTLSGLSNAGVAYTSESDVRFVIGEDRVLLTDGVNQAHFVEVSNDGVIESGVLGIAAPGNHAKIDPITDYDPSDWEMNEDEQYFSAPGLIQVLYTVVTDDGEESSPSPISLTHDAQWFKIESGEDAQWVNRFTVRDLSIPDVSETVRDQLDAFKVYARVFRYAEGEPAQSFEYTQEYKILDKSSTSGSTGNAFSVAVQPTPGDTPAYDSEPAPIARIGTEVSGVTFLGDIVPKNVLPFQFDYVYRIVLNNLNAETYTDGVYRLRLREADIPNLDWSTYDTDGNGVIEASYRKKIRLYDEDVRTPLPVVYTDLDATNGYCDLYVRIPQVRANSLHSLYLAYGVNSEGVTNSDYRTFEYGTWFPLGTANWDNQAVFTSRNIPESGAMIFQQFNTAEFATGKLYNRADINHSFRSVNSLRNQSPITAPQAIGTGYEVGNDAVLMNADSGVTRDYEGENLEIPEKGYAIWTMEYYGGDTPSSDTYLCGFYDDLNDFLLGLGFDYTDLKYTAFTYDGTYTKNDFTFGYPTSLDTHRISVCFSWDLANNKASVFAGDLNTTSSFNADEVTIPDPNTAYRYIRLNSFVNQNDMILDQWSMVQGRYYSGASTSDQATVRNMMNLQPAFDEPVGYDFENSSVNANITFEPVNNQQGERQRNQIAFSDINGVAFSPLYRRKTREPLKALISAPSYMQNQYENAVLAFSRNYINRFMLSGTPDGWSVDTDTLIEHYKHWGLMAEKSLIRIGDTLFWYSEKGVIRMRQDGIANISQYRLDLPQRNDYIGFFVPVRQQYCLHDNVNNITYVYHLPSDTWTQFTGLDIQQAETLSGGSAADNKALFLRSDDIIHSYPGANFTSQAARARTREFDMTKGVLMRLNPIFGGSGQIITRVQDRYEPNTGERSHTFSSPVSADWQGVPNDAGFGQSFDIEFSGFDTIESLLIDYKKRGITVNG